MKHMSVFTNLSPADLTAFTIGVGCALLAGWFLLPEKTDPYAFTAAADPNAVHVHADFLMYLDHERYRFTDDHYQSTSEDVQHEHLHLHNNNDYVIHRHAANQTFADFLTSLNYTLTDDCLITDTDISFCDTDNGTGELVIYVNDIPIDNHTEYVFADEDKILVYYGDPNDERVATYLAEITDDACIHSGTCPERGVAPPEECGITCEI